MIVGNKKIKNNKESQYKVLHPETGSDSLIGSDWESGCDRNGFVLSRHLLFIFIYYGENQV